MLAIGVLFAMEGYAQPAHAKGNKGHKNPYSAKKYHKTPHHAYPVAKNNKAVKTRYYYYPGKNVYYNPGNRRYAYYGPSGWVWVNTLPPGLVIAGAPRHIVYYEGPQVWVANPVHMRTYGPRVNVNVQF